MSLPPTVLEEDVYSPGVIRYLSDFVDIAEFNAALDQFQFTGGHTPLPPL
jgi:hypothetical protein